MEAWHLKVPYASNVYILAYFLAKHGCYQDLHVDAVTYQASYPGYPQIHRLIPRAFIFDESIQNSTAESNQ
jgi:hypothetical protein